jgi:virulence-associated protein VagC
MSVKILELVETPEGQVVRLPPEFRFYTASISIRREGQMIILEPVKPTTLPADFFEKIRIDDPAFKRPDQGEMPPAPSFE